jgi:hypothetical protein
MNYSGSYSNTDDFASATWPNPWAMGDYAHYPNLSVPQSTYPDPVSAPGYPSTAGPNHVPDFNAADDAALSLAPTAEMGAFALPIQADYTNQVSSQCVRTSTWTYPAAPQNIIDPWSMPGPCMFLSCICHYSSYSPDANPKPTSMRIPRSPSRNWLGSSIGPGSIPLPPTRWLQHLT